MFKINLLFMFISLLSFGAQAQTVTSIDELSSVNKEKLSKTINDKSIINSHTYIVSVPPVVETSFFYDSDSSFYEYEIDEDGDSFKTETKEAKLVKSQLHRQEVPKLEKVCKVFGYKDVDMLDYSIEIGGNSQGQRMRGRLKAICL